MARQLASGVVQISPSTPGVRLPSFSDTRFTAIALAEYELTRNRCRAFTLRQSCSRVALAIRICSPLTRRCTVGQSIRSHAPPAGKAAESALTGLILACLLSGGFGIRSRHTKPHGSQRPFRVEHVVSYPDDYCPAFACSVIPYPLPIHTLCSSLTRPAHPGGKITGLPSSTAMTRWGGCCLSTGGAVSACPDLKARHPTACPFGSGAYSYFRLFNVTVVAAVHLGSPDHRAWPLIRL